MRAAAWATIALAACSLATSCKKHEQAAPEPPAGAVPRVSRTDTGQVVITLDHDDVERAGLASEPVVAQSHRKTRLAYGRVLDPAPLAALEGELASAEASLEASKAGVERLRLLNQDGESVSRKSLESAEAAWRGDDSRVRAARQKLALGWGPLVARLDAAGRRDFLERCASGRRALVRVDLVSGEPMEELPSAVRIAVAGREDHPFSADEIAPAPSVDPSLPGGGYFLRVDSETGSLRPGTPVSAWLDLPGEPQSGVVIPRSAVVRFGGKAWAYVQTSPAVAEKTREQFVRREVAVDQPVEQGWFVTSGFAAGDRVVVTGPQSLMSEELISQTGSAKEGD
ncbi:MAG TPA: hypothetical protein VK661_00525 [Planctomycetota bacterium]|nr:hypothetical protein [Planctomycetota bacterium]